MDYKPGLGLMDWPNWLYVRVTYRWLMRAFLAGIGFALALLVVAAVYDSAVRHGYAQCEAWYEDEPESKYWDMPTPGSAHRYD